MMNLTNKIDFVAVITVKNANPNGDPINGNRPRTDYNGLGEMSDVCIKRKIRNRMMDLDKCVFVQSADKKKDDCKSLKDRADSVFKKNMDEEEVAKLANETWLDVRAFGQVFAFKGQNLSVGVRGPVSIHQAVSVFPVEVEDMQITKSVNSVTEKGKSPDTMGTKHFVRFGVYTVKGSINVQLAEKTGFSEEDADVIKECLRTLFINDSSSARPDGSMEVVKLYWFKHNCKDGQYSSAKVHKSIHIDAKDGVVIPNSIEDCVITREILDGLYCEEIDGI